MKINSKKFKREVPREGLLVIVMHYMTLVGNSSDALEITKLLETMCSELITSHYSVLWRVTDESIVSNTLQVDKEICIKADKGLLHRAITQKISGVYNLVDEDELYVAAYDNSANHAYKDMLLFPIKNEQNEVIALLQSATHPDDLHQFTLSDLDVIESISIFLAKVVVSMENDTLDNGNRQEDKFVEQSQKMVDKLQNDLHVEQIKVQKRTQFLAEIAHEIRTPMHAMMGFIELLREEEKDEVKSMYLQNAHKSAQNMALLLNDTLDFTKVDKGEMHLEQNENSLMLEMYSMVSMFYMKMRSSQLYFYAYIDPLIPKTLALDTPRIRQIISNLLSNAIKFTPSFGTIILDVSYDEENKIINFSVKDSGVGIAKENQEKIFMDYSQEDDSISRVYGGTGLGLSISSQLVKLFNSTLHLESEQNVGSCFSFSIDISGKLVDDRSALNLDKIKQHKVLIVCSKEHQFILKGIKKSYLRAGLAKTELLHVESLESVDLSEFNYLYISDELLDENSVKSFVEDKKCLFIIDSNKKININLHDAMYFFEGALFMHEVLKVSSSLGIVLDEKLQNRTILTVDDNPINLDLMESVLKKMGTSVLKARDGQEALALYKETLESKEKIDMIFMDQNMPGMSGCEVTAAIKAYEKEKEIDSCTIIGLCGTNSTRLIEQFEEVGVLECLFKPVCIETIKETINKYM